MKMLHPRAFGRPALTLAVLLLALAWIAAACAPPPAAPAPPAGGSAQTAAPSPAATVQEPAAAPTQAQAAQPTATAAGAKPAFDTSKLPTGVTADGNFYRGDANAPVKLIEYSDFQ